MSKINIKYNLVIAYAVIGYLALTFLMYLFLPIKYIGSEDFGNFKVGVFLVLICIAFYMGCKTVTISNYVGRFIIKKQKNFEKLIWIVLVFNIVLILDAFLNGDISFNMGINYINRLARIEEENSEISLMGQINVLINPLKIYVLAYGMFIFLKMNYKTKIIFILFLVTILFYSLFYLGVNKDFGDIVIIGIFSQFLYWVKLNKISKFIKIGSVVLTIFLTTFLVNNLSRSYAYGIKSASDLSNRYIDVQVKNPNIIESTLLSFSIYISHGYKGLSYCLELPFEWTKFSGSSRALSSYFEQYLGSENEFYNTYPMRMEEKYGWPALQYWPTAFAWWASDITFFGVVILMFFIGRFFCTLFKEAYLYSNPLSIVLFSYMGIMIVFLPSNNQLFQSRPSLVASVVLLTLWFIRHRKYNTIKRQSDK